MKKATMKNFKILFNSLGTLFGSMRLRVKVCKYCAFVALWIAIGFALQLLLLPFYYELDLSVHDYVLFSVGLAVPVSITLAAESKGIRRRFEAIMFQFLVLRDIVKRIEELDRLLKSKDKLEEAIHDFARIFDIFGLISDIFSLRELENAIGENMYKFMVQKFMDLEPSMVKQVNFRKPVIVTRQDVSVSLKEDLIHNHVFIKKVVGKGYDDLAWCWLSYCLLVYLRGINRAISKEFLESANQILYTIAMVENSLVEYEDDNSRREMGGFVKMMQLWLFYLFDEKGSNLITYQKGEINKTFLGWLASIDLSTRTSTVLAFESATQYFFQKFTQDGQRITSLTKELAELMNSREMDRFSAIKGLKAFAKSSLANEHKTTFIESLKNELVLLPSFQTEYVDLLDNILLYFSVMSTVAAISNKISACPGIGIQVEVNPTGSGTCDIVFNDKTGILIDRVQNTSLLFDRNALGKSGNLSKIESISEKSLSEIVVRVSQGEALRILAWPFGVTSTETTFMGIWPPTIDSILFLEVLKKSGYFSHSIRSIIDIGAGSGILGLSFLAFGSHSHVVFTDVNGSSKHWIRANAAINNLDPNDIVFIRSKSLDSILESNIGRFDFALLSPPYLPLFMIQGTATTNVITDRRHGVILDEYAIETMDTGLLYDVIVNFKKCADRLLVLYSSIADDVVSSALDHAKKQGSNLSVTPIFEQVVPLKIKGIVPLTPTELTQWSPQKLAPIQALKSRGRLFDPPPAEHQSYPFWQKLKIVEFS